MQVGGNGGNAGANAIQQKCEEADVFCNVIGVPKSIDNDILLIDKCFGFDTAVEEAQRALLAAKVEASSARHGIGLVKLMGRQSGFIAMQASMASGGCCGPWGRVCDFAYVCNIESWYKEHSSIPLITGRGKAHRSLTPSSKIYRLIHHSKAVCVCVCVMDLSLMLHTMP
jgi:6-phosphofructokinase